MQTILPTPTKPIPTRSISHNPGPLTLRGTVHALRNFGGVRFLVLRRYDGVVQCVLVEGLPTPQEGDTVELQGLVRPEPRAPHGAELCVQTLRVLSRPSQPLPVPIHKAGMNLGLEAELSLRPITLRNLRRRAAMKLGEGIVHGFRGALVEQGFTEIHTPKLCARGAEGGANMFRVNYFGQPACLAQSPQLYKQMMVGVFERVFEVGPVFRAEKHNTARHLSEYTSLDLEMAFIDDFKELMAMETFVLGRIFALLKAQYDQELKLLDLALPKIDAIPALRFADAKALTAQAYGALPGDPYDLSPEEEQRIGQYALEHLGSELVFITHYPARKRPFYAMEDPEDSRLTLSFDLLFRGMEITTGGQRIHDYDAQLAKLQRFGMEEEGLEGYLLLHKHGVAPHGGFGLGLERMLKQLLGEANIRQACLFPRDTTRLSP